MEHQHHNRINGEKLLNGQLLGSDRLLRSANGRYYLAMQKDGNLVIYNGDNHIAQNSIWASNTWNKGPAPHRAIIQADGNFVLYDASNHPQWASGTYQVGHPGHYVVMQNDGNLVVFDGHGQPTWASNTVRNDA